jgi:hypothetical protein
VASAGAFDVDDVQISSAPPFSKISFTILFVAIFRVNRDKIVTALEFTFVTFGFDLGDS